MYFGQTEGSGLTQYDCQRGLKAHMETECDVGTRTLKHRRRNLCVTMGKHFFPQKQFTNYTLFHWFFFFQ